MTFCLSEVNTIQQRWATKKAGGSSHNGRDSHGKRLGVKKFDGKLIHHFKLELNLIYLFLSQFYYR
jgi:hypothetical protein